MSDLIDSLQADEQSSNLVQLDEMQSVKNEIFIDYFDPRFPKSISIALFFIGLMGNALSFNIFAQKNMRKNSTFVYLAFLSIVDIVVLGLGLGDIILISYFKYVIRNESLLVCRFLSFLIYACTHLSSFILASVSIDRAIATNYINFSKVYCKPRTAYKVIALNVLLACLLDFHNLVLMGHEIQSAQSYNLSLNYMDNSSLPNYSYILNKDSFALECRCESVAGTWYDRFLDPYFKWIDLLAYAFIPFLVMAICTYLITRVLFLSNKRLSSNNNNRKSSSIKKADNGRTTATADSQTVSSSLLNRKQTNQRANKAKHLTYTLITLNCLFFCLVSPLVICLIAVNDDRTTYSKILLNIVYLLAYSNHSFNFILYGVSSPPFREALIKMLSMKQASRGANASHLNATLNSKSKTITATSKTKLNFSTNMSNKNDCNLAVRLSNNNKKAHTSLSSSNSVELVVANNNNNNNNSNNINRGTAFEDTNLEN